MTTGTPALNDKTPNILIAVMGATGTGKSTLIYTLTGNKNIVIGHGQESQTTEVEEFTYFDSANNCFVTLIDTPGFDDSRGVSDTDVLKKIVFFLQMNGGKRLNGLIYLHRISDPKMGGISKRNLRLFKQLCGDGSLRNVCITTTNWSRVTKEEGDRRELELRESPRLFQPLINGGAHLARHYKDVPSALSIVNLLICKDPTKLQIQIELDRGLTLEKTSTGAVLRDEIIALRAKQDKEMKDLKDDMEKAAREKHAELLAELEEERQEREAQKKKMEEDLENLKMQARGDKMKHEEEMRRLEEKTAMDVKEMEAKLLAEREAREELERNNRERLELLKHEEKIHLLEDKVAMDAKKIEAEFLAERKAREELERNNRELRELMKQQAQRDKEKHEADLLKKRMEAETKAREKQAKAESVRRERERREKMKREEEEAEERKAWWGWPLSFWK